MSTMKRGLCWALAALQVTPENVNLKDNVVDGGTIHLPLGSSNSMNNNNNNNNNHHHSIDGHDSKHQNVSQPLGQKNTLSSETSTSSAVSLLKDTVHSVVDALLGPSEDRENVQPSYSRQEVSDHCYPDSCWLVVNNRVYDVTRFLRMHPGGEDIVLEHGGHDATTAFIEKGHSLDAFDMLGEYYIGEIAEEDRYPEMNCT